jgi:hypothetical protein
MKKMKYFLIVCIFLISFSANTYSATKTWTGTSNSNWADGTNWGGTAPGINDIVNIPTVVSGIYPVINSAVSIGNGKITINSNSGAGANLSIISGGTLTTTGLITILANGIFTLSGGNSTLNGITSSGIIDVQSGTLTSTTNITISAGVLTQSGGLIHMATTTVTNPTNDLVINGGTVTQSGGTIYTRDFTPSTGIFNQTGSTALFRIFRNWQPSSGHTFNSTSGTVRFSGTPGASATFTSTNSQFNNLIIDTAIDPGFDNNANSIINISGDLTNNNSTLINSANATFLFNGTSTQTITSSSRDFIGNLTVNKSNGLVSLASNISIAGTLNMTSGNINTGGNILILGTNTFTRGTFLYTSGVIITGSTGGFKRWFINASVSNRVFPVGTSNNNNSITFSFIEAPSTGGTLTARFISSDPGSNSSTPINDVGYTINTYSSIGYWQIDTGDGLTGGIYSLSLRGQGFNPSGTEITNYQHLRVMKREGPGLNWIVDGTHIDATGSNNDPSIQRTGLSGFSQFAMGGNASDGNPLQGALPVELSLFSYLVNTYDVVLNWVTESEKNNRGFEIYRSNLNSDWKKVGYVEGIGNSNTQKTYTFEDNNLGSGIYNYRLKQIDFNGNFIYYNLNSNVVIGVPGKFNVKQNFPNPFNPLTKISYAIPTDANVSLKIYDISGREIKQLVNEKQNAGYYSVIFNGQNISSGIYIYQLIAGNNIVTKKMILIK